MSNWLGFAHPWWLLALPLALLPLYQSLLPPWRFSSLGFLPPDRASVTLAAALRAAGVLAIAALVVALAGPYRPSYQVERSGQGAEIVLVLDRSLSMDQPFGTEGRPLQLTPGGKILGYERPLGEFTSKGRVARQALADFVGERQADRFGMVAFSTLPMRVLDFTEKSAVVQAAVTAGDAGRGLSETDIGAALLEGLSFFDQRAYTGSRILLLVSDGGDHLHPDLRDRLSQLMRQHRVSLYWLYLRSFGNPGLAVEHSEDAATGGAIPERTMHAFFETLGVPYKAYEVDSPDVLRRAVADVNRLENLPITYVDTVSRRDLSPAFISVALAGLLLLSLASALGVTKWR